MHQRRIVALDEMRIVAIAAQQLGQFLAADARQHRRIGDLEAVQMKDRKHRAIARRVEKLVGVPAGGQRAGFRLAVADDAGDDQIRIVESGAIGVEQRIAQFAAFMNGARRFRRHMAGNSIRPGELPEQPMQSVPAALDRRIALGIGPFQIGVRHDARAAMAGTDDVDHVEIVVFDQPVEMECRRPIRVNPGGGQGAIAALGARHHLAFFRPGREKRNIAAAVESGISQRDARFGFCADHHHRPSLLVSFNAG